MEKELIEVIQQNFEVIAGVFNLNTKEWIVLSAADVGTREDKRHEILQVKGKKFHNIYELLGFIPADGKVTWITLGEDSRKRIIESFCRDLKSLVKTGKTAWDLRIEKKEEKEEVGDMEKSGKQMFCFTSEKDTKKAFEMFEKLVTGNFEVRSAVNWNSSVSGVVYRIEGKGGYKVVMECADKEIAWILQQFLDWHFKKVMRFISVIMKEECIEVKYERLEEIVVKKPLRIIKKKKIDEEPVWTYEEKS